MVYYSVSDTSAIYHHGIKGMHWYIRRFQPYQKGDPAASEGKFIGRKKRTHKGVYADERAAIKKTVSDTKERVRDSLHEPKEFLDQRKEQKMHQKEERREAREEVRSSKAAVRASRRDKVNEALQQRASEKADVVNEGNLITDPTKKLEYVQKNLKYYSDQEIRDAISRYKVATDLNNTIRQSKPPKKVDQFLAKMDKVGNNAERIGRFISKGAKTYNTVALTYNGWNEDKISRRRLKGMRIISGMGSFAGGQKKKK